MHVLAVLFASKSVTGDLKTSVRSLHTQTAARACSPNTMPVNSVRALEPTVRASASRGGCDVTPPAAACAPGLPRLAPAPARSVRAA